MPDHDEERKKRTREDVFCEILQTSAASDSKKGPGGPGIAERKEKGRADRRKVQESQQEQ